MSASHRFRRLCTVCVGVLALRATPTHAQQPESLRTYVYKTVHGVEIKADVHRPAVDDVTPAVLWLHGGALVTGRRHNIRLHELKRYLDEGYTVVAIDYRLAPETKLPAILDDVRDAWAWVRKNAVDLRIDPDRIGVVGHSAGGYLALMTGFMLNPRPPVVVAFYGYGDISGAWCSEPDSNFLKQPLVSEAQAHAAIGTHELSEAGGSQRGSLYVYLRQHGTWTETVTGSSPRRVGVASFKKFCPVFNVTGLYPAALLLHGDADTDVPFQQAVDMDEVLTRAGVQHEFVRLAGKDHGFDANMTDPDVSAAFDREVQFLNAHLHPEQKGATRSGGSAEPRGSVTISDAWARATPAGAKMGVVYMKLLSATGDRLLGASVPASVSGEAQLHVTVLVHNPDSGEDSMVMHQIPSIELPAGQTVELGPGGLHVMLIGLEHPLRAGERVKVSLHLEQAGIRTVTAVVRGL